MAVLCVHPDFVRDQATGAKIGAEKRHYRPGDVAFIRPDDYAPTDMDRETFIYLRVPGDEASWKHMVETVFEPSGLIRRLRRRYVDLSKVLTPAQEQTRKDRAPKVVSRRRRYSRLGHRSKDLYRARIGDRQVAYAAIQTVVDQLDASDRDLAQMRLPIIDVADTSRLVIDRGTA